MNAFSYDVLPTVCAAVVAIFAVQGITIYAVVKVVVLGRSLCEKREQEPGEKRVNGPWRPA